MTTDPRSADGSAITGSVTGQVGGGGGVSGGAVSPTITPGLVPVVTGVEAGSEVHVVLRGIVARYPVENECLPCINGTIAWPWRSGAPSERAAVK